MAKAGNVEKKQSGLTRIFLGWDRPILHTTCDYLQERFLKNGRWDMDQVLIVIPSSWAGRRLGELLADRAQGNGWLLRPPEIVTVGTLPEKLYQARFPFASDLVQVLCWTKVLREFDTDQLMPLLIDVPSRDVLQPWVDLAGMLSSLHLELATDLLLFSDVADRLQGTQEEARWRVLQKLQRKYLDELDRHKLWDIQTARRVAIDRGEPQTKQQIIVVGSVDMNRAQRRFLDAVADNVTALIGAPETWSQGFDPHGALIPEYWQDLQVKVDPRCLHVRGTAVEAAAEAVRQLAYLPEATSTVHVTVGVPDVELIPLLAEQFDRCRLKARYGAGIPVTQSPPMKMLATITEYLDTGDFASFAALIRLPAVSRMLRQQGELAIDYLQHVDAYYNDTLLRSVNAVVWPESPSREIVQGIVSRIDEWLKPLRNPAQTLAQWSQPLLEVLQATYRATTLNLDLPEDSALWEACSKMTDAVSRLDDVPESLQVPVSVTEAIGWVHRFLEKERIPPPADPSAIEMLGWLELALDDADVLVLTGIHDGMVPESINADAFLPNELRKQLGLMDNSRRYARDSYVMQTILHARKYLAIVLNNLNTEGDPLIPSRLLLAVPSDELGPRVQYLLEGDPNAKAPRVAGRWKPKLGQSNLPIPKPTPTQIPTAIPVTDFRRYQECPYRYYLSQVLRLKSMDDLKVELEANDFGNLIHDCVAKMKGSTIASSSQEEAIRDWLLKEVDDLAKIRYGISPPVAVQIQLEQAKQRLTAFAAIQAQRSKDGWEIREVEFGVSSEQPVELETSRGVVLVYGRMDRIDRSSSGKEWGIWDYKTGDSANHPLKAHYTKSAGWKDFQLPLYRKLGARAKIPNDAPVELGYIQIPKSASETKFETAVFESSQLAEAYEQVGEIYRAIQSQAFWPPNQDYDSPWDAFAAICQTNVARPWDEQAALLENPNEDTDGRSLKSNGVAKSSVAPLLPLLIERSKRVTDGRPVSLKLEPMELEGEIPVDWFSPLVIRASAGTGKTYQLAVRMMRLLFSNQPLDHVLATTFTRKAAGEILRRVLTQVALAITDENSLQELKGILDPLPVTKKHCEYQLARLCSQLHRFRVCTLDSFYKQLASSFSLELEFPPGWSLVDPFVESQLSDQAIAKLFETYGGTELRTLVGMLFKGDSGRSVQGQIRSVVKDGYKLYRSTDPQAWEALEIPVPPSESKVESALQLVGKTKFQHKSADAGVLDLVQNVQDANWDAVLNSTLVKNSFAEPPQYYKKPIDSEVADALQVLGRLAFSHEARLRIEQTKAAYKLLHAYHEQLEIAKRQSRAASFEDIAFRLSRWIAKRIRRKANEPSKDVGQDASSTSSVSNESIDFRMDSRVDHLLLDEFQDTSPQQWDIIRPFAETIARESLLKGNSFFCVGDTKQAIYGWRGGVAQIFDSVSKQIDGVQEQSLSQSYRSSPRIMEFVNLVFENLDKHTNYGDVERVTKDWMDRFPRHETARSTLPGYVVLKNGPAKSKDGEELGGGSLMETAADEVAALAQSAPNVSIGVLVRTNENVGQMIHLLRERKVDASQEGGNPLSDSAAVELILSLMHLADHPGDRVVAFHLHRSPLGDRLELSPWVAPDRLAEKVRSRITQDGYGPTVAYYSGLLAPDCNLRDQQRLEQLIQLAYRYEAKSTTRVRDFALFVRETKVALPRPSQVRVMNIHQSKGLEFDAVFLTDLDKGLVGQPQNYLARYEDRTERPTGVIRHCSKELRRYLSDEWNRVFEDYAQQQLYESMCVFYVALTRARKALYLYTSPGKSSTQEWGSVLHSILVANPDEKSQGNRVLYTLGDEEWYRIAKVNDKQPDVFEEALTGDEDTEGETELRVPLHPPEPGQQTRLRPTSKPSAAGEPRLVSLKAALEPSESIGAIIGTLVHRWFEEVLWLDDFRWDRPAMRDLALRTLAPQDMLQVDLDALLSDMERMLSMDSVKRSLQRSRYDRWRNLGIDTVEVDNEVRLLEIMDGYLLRGTIDRLVLGKKDGKVVCAEILDYKTDSIDRSVSMESWILERADHHRKQLELYRRVLCQQYGIESKEIELTLILLSADHLESLHVGQSLRD